MNPAWRFFFEDIEVGAVTRFGEKLVTREEVIDFAGKYDPQPFHLSDEAAAQSHFGRLAASGWHTAAMTMAMTVAHLGDIGFASMGGAGIDELRWLAPVYPGDVLSVETTVLDKRQSQSRPGMGLVRQQTAVCNQSGVAVLRFVATVLVATRAGAAD